MGDHLPGFIAQSFAERRGDDSAELAETPEAEVDAATEDTAAPETNTDRNDTAA